MSCSDWLKGEQFLCILAGLIAKVTCDSLSILLRLSDIFWDVLSSLCLCSSSAFYSRSEWCSGSSLGVHFLIEEVSLESTDGVELCFGFGIELPVWI